MRVCLSGNGQGELAAAIRLAMALASSRYGFIDDGPLRQTTANPESADVAICTTGRMRINDPNELTWPDAQDQIESNFTLPFAFTERHIAAMIRDGRHGLILHLGSNAAWYGNVGAELYAAGKTALRKYLELRARAAKAHGIRISLLGFGGVSTTGFWEKAVDGATAVGRDLAKSIVAGDRAPLTPQEVALVVLHTIELPANVCVKDALITSVHYQ